MVQFVSDTVSRQVTAGADSRQDEKRKIKWNRRSRRSVSVLRRDYAVRFFVGLAHMHAPHV